MTLLGAILFVALVGFLVWALTALVPMPDKFKTVIYVVAIAGVVFYLLAASGLLAQIPNPKVNP